MFFLRNHFIKTLVMNLYTLGTASFLRLYEGIIVNSFMSYTYMLIKSILHSDRQYLNSTRESIK